MPEESVLRRRHRDGPLKISGRSREDGKSRHSPGIPEDGSETGPDSVTRQLAWAAGMERLKNRPPSYQLSEQFQEEFEHLGRKGFDMSDKYQTRPGDDRLKAFRDISLQRGALSAGIVSGTGKMMLVSCLKRTLGQERPFQLRERKLFQSISVHRDLPESRNVTEVVNRGFTDSAVGIVTDTLKNARTTLDGLEKLAQGESQIDGISGMGTIRKMYPFLFSDREEALLRHYAEKLKPLAEKKELSEAEAAEKRMLENGRAKIEALLNKKQQTKREFLQKLRVLRERAEEAEQNFSDPEFLEQLSRFNGEAEESAEDPKPPETENDEPDTEDAKDPS